MGISVNKVILIGQLKCPPKLTKLKSGREMCSLEIITTEEESDAIRQVAHRVKVFGDKASHLAMSLKMGDTLYVEGRINSKPWATSRRTGQLIDEVHGERVEALGPKRKSNISYEAASEAELAAEISLSDIKYLSS